MKTPLLVVDEYNPSDADIGRIVPIPNVDYESPRRRGFVLGVVVLALVSLLAAMWFIWR